MPLHNRGFDEWSASPSAGPLFNDYSSVGYSLLIKKNNLINVSNSQAVWRQLILRDRGSLYLVQAALTPWICYRGSHGLATLLPQFCHHSNAS